MRYGGKYRLSLFQFYLSSIKSIFVRNAVKRFRGFNSTLVQLKASNMLEDNQFYLGFNSTLVQLKDYYQFIINWYILGFNSTLVQLKVWAIHLDL